MIGGFRGIASVLALGLLASGAMIAASEPARAADLGGDCCADLEERIAELEATTVRKGNKKVKVQLYGRMNRVNTYWDDGGLEHFDPGLNNSYSSTRFGFKGSAKIADNWKTGFQIEIEDEGLLTKFIDQFGSSLTPVGGLNVRRSALFVEHENYGTLWWGHWSTAKDDITKDNIVIKGLDQSMHADFYMNWSYFLRPVGTADDASGLTNIRYRDIGRCYSTSSSAFDCSTRRPEVRYDTPEFLGGFIASAAYGGGGKGEIWSAGLRYNKEFENWKIGAGYAYEDFDDETLAGTPPFGVTGTRRQLNEYAGSFSVLHKPTGLFVWGANSNSENDDPLARGVFTGRRAPKMEAWDIAGGLHRDFFPVGATTIWGGYTQDEDGIGNFNSTVVTGGASYSIWSGRIAADRIPGIGFDTEITGSETTKWYVGVDQEIKSASMNLYIAFQHIEPEIDLVDINLDRVSVPLEEFDVIFAGGRINF